MLIDVQAVYNYIHKHRTAMKLKEHVLMLKVYKLQYTCYLLSIGYLSCSNSCHSVKRNQTVHVFYTTFTYSLPVVMIFTLLCTIPYVLTTNSQVLFADISCKREEISILFIYDMAMLVGVLERKLASI